MCVSKLHNINKIKCNAHSNDMTKFEFRLSKDSEGNLCWIRAINLLQ